MTSSSNKIGLLKNPATGESFELDMAPFTPETLWEAGGSENWDELRSVLRPVLGRADFAVTDAVSQAFVDLVRRALDSSTSADYGNTAVKVVVDCEVEGDDDVLKLLLEAGADPDIPSKKGWRASHVCGELSRVEAAAVLFPCRPDMAALNGNDDTPLAAAQKKRYDYDDKFPARVARRPAVAKLITDNKYDQGAFPTIAELACHQKWFAVKNLVRRQVVLPNEFEETFSGKTAAEWARIHKQDKMAQELEYYAQLPTCKLLKAKLEIKTLQEQVAKERENVEAAKVEQEKDKRKIAELELLLETHVATILKLENDSADEH